MNIDVSYTLQTMSVAEQQPLTSLATAENFGDPHFRCLGVGADGNTYIFQPSNVSQIIELSASAMKGAAMYRLAPLHWWEREFEAKKDGVNWNAAINGCVQACLSMGVFDPKRVVGRGVMLEPGTRRRIAHLGDRVLIDDELTAPGQLDSAIFVARPPIDVPPPSPLSTHQSKRLLSLFERLEFVQPDMARLLAGACVIAPLCGALDWRPLIWLSGPAGSGKTWAMSDLIGGLLGKLALPVAGSATEAGIRQSLGPDILPVLMDEAESKDDDSARRIAAILELARASASRGGAEIRKGSASGKAVTYNVRSSFLFSSVDPADLQTADESRIVKLELKAAPLTATVPEMAKRAENFAAMKAELAEMLRAGFGPRLFWRSYSLLNTITMNAEDFAFEIAARTGNGRLGDVMGPLIAGWYSLISDKRTDRKKAKELLDDWTWLRPALGRTTVEPDSVKALRHLLSSQLNMDHGQRRSIGELVGMASHDDVAAQSCLNRNGFRVQDGRFLIHRKTGSLKALFHGTQWRNDPAKTMQAHPKAALFTKQVRFTVGMRDRPLAFELDDLE